ncbi:Glucose-6-phosphate 1-epimerase [Portunus trituberculatus]|uniref:Galactose mutarotase n=1 Tax=Portunus trituberculatus TaxID=210409 RepID=A0A5B7D8P9_PORTR|nr:Glucose-6-phosphate 1-epimerase [Portunus trituberculatus]
MAHKNDQEKVVWLHSEAVKLGECSQWCRDSAGFLQRGRKKAREGAMYQEHRDVVTVNEWTDRIYQNTPLEHIITNVVSGRKMRMQKYNLVDTVVWNPWVEKAKEIPDFGEEEFPNLVCVEAGHVSSPVILPPGTVFEASQILQVM